MNPYIIYILILIIIVLILIGIIYLGYWIPKKMGKRKIGILISRILAIGIVLMILSFIFEDNLFFKSDAKEFLAKQQIELKDDFKILENKSGGFMDYYHRFKLEISDKDKNRLIDKITSEQNYVDKIQNNFHLPDIAVNRYEGDTITTNYETDWEYKTEIYYSNGKGYTPTHKIISISKKESKLIFEHILD
jgi:hypothetical protein